ncbi:MAG: BamA/TamA family outer membrane protein [candidate division Zixibacteria bacterium]|nr:BamA/TamA family outer membrane protein [candidate division Zixibacteria bacterium]
MLDNKFIILILIASIIFLGILAPAASAETDYQNKLIIDYDKNDLFISIEYNGSKMSMQSDCRELRETPDGVELGNGLLFSRGQIVWGDVNVPYKLLKQDKFNKISGSRIYMEFKIKDAPSKSRIPRDIVNSFDDLIIDSDRFVRGDVFNFGSDVDLYGEVSDNLICFFGDIVMHTNSLVRGDVIAVCGRVYRHEDSQVYGEIFSQEGWEEGGRKLGLEAHYGREVSLRPALDYNRVDGLYLETFLEYEDATGVFPSFEVGVGYAFEAERLRYRLEASQRIFDYYAIEPHGRIYRETATEDDWIVPEFENAIFALVVNEDFRDYYEKEGGEIGLKIYLGPYNSLDFSYSYDDIKWMDAHPKLWSLFGSKEFRGNWSSLPGDYLQENMSDFDSKLSLFKFTYKFDMLDNIYRPRAGWYAGLQFEKGGGDLKGDLTYSRWILSGIRYQPINRYLSLKMRVMYGGSSDRVPLFKKFYLGGIRTLRGYDIKEFYGDQMFLANIEYQIDYKAFLHTALFFDIGKTIGQDDDIFSDGEFKSDIGVALGFSRSFRVEFAKALDDSDSDIHTWVVFSRSF